MTSRVVLCSLVAAACAGLMAAGSAPGTPSHALGLWTPHPVYDSCSAAYHDSFSAVGSDGKRYPTWHPPEGVENGEPCTFGHEHGRDPKGSALLADIEAQYGGVLFGFANEQLDTYNASQRVTDRMRHEDHVGHKIEWENDVTVFESTTSAMRPLRITCDFFMKVHQGTHSPDAFTNNLHELLYAAQCFDRAGGTVGTKVIAFTMVRFGIPGGFSEGSPAGGFNFVPVGSAAPAGSPTGNGLRSLPTLGRILTSIVVPPTRTSDYSRGLYEDWLSSNYLQREGPEPALAYFDPHFAVFLPSRFHWPTGEGLAVGVARTAADTSARLGRTIDLCSMRAPGEARARGGECDSIRDAEPPVTFDDPRSPFNGVRREFYFNQTTIANASGPDTWFTDPFGGHASTSPFPGAIRQFIAAVDNRRRNDAGVISAGGRLYHFESRALGKDRWYGGRGVHAPN